MVESDAERMVREEGCFYGGITGYSIAEWIILKYIVAYQYRRFPDVYSIAYLGNL